MITTNFCQYVPLPVKAHPEESLPLVAAHLDKCHEVHPEHFCYKKETTLSASSQFAKNH